MTAPTVRAVVVTWNGAHLIRPCLDSLLAQDLDGSLHVVVVDNASTDGTAAVLAQEYPQVEVRVTHKNLGFAGGVNVGLVDLAEASVDYVFLLNNDAVVEPAAVRTLVEHLEDPAHHDVGAASAHILLSEPDSQGRVLVNSTGNVLHARGTASDRDWLAVAGTEHAAEDVFGFCGGAALLRAAALDDVGLFDASLFLYYEDTDLSWRMRASGWTIHYVAGAVAHHRHAASSDAASPLFRFHNTRNSLLVFGRHAPLPVVIASFLRQSAACVAYSLTRREPPGVLRVRRSALAAVVRASPQTVRLRRATWAGRSAQRRQIFSSAVARD